MNEGLVNESTTLEVAAEGVQHQTKDEEHSLKLQCHKILKPQDDHNDSSHIPPREYNDVRQGAMSQFLHPSHISDDAGDMVEELTVRSYNGSRLDIGTLSNRGPLYNRQNQWQLASDSGIGGSQVDTGCRNSDQATSSVGENFGSTTFPEVLAGKSLSDDKSDAMEHLTNVEDKAEHKEDEDDAHEGVRTKIISKSGFAEYLIKNMFKGDGIVCKGLSSNGLYVESRDQNLIKAGIGTQMDSSVSLNPGSKTAKC